MSTTMRFNITLPTDVGLKLSASKNRSRIIAESLRDTFARQENEKLNDVLAEGYASRAKEDAVLNREFDHIAGDGIE
jgi:uncharacterized Zn finger protein